MKKYISLENYDLFSSEAKRSLTKFKIYRPKEETLKKDPKIV